MPQRKTLGTNIGPAGRTGGMMAAFGFAVPSPPEPPAPLPASPAPPAPPESLAPFAPEPGEPAPRPPRRHRSRIGEREVPPPESPPSDAPDLASGAVARIATGISAETLDLARRAAYWNRETLRSFLEHAIEAAARRIEEEQGLAPLPSPSPPLRRGRPPRV
jgi:hypothetical protein